MSSFAAAAVRVLDTSAVSKMKDSRLFLQWAMNTARHEHEQPAAAVNDDCNRVATFPSLQAFREAPAKSWSSCDTTDGSSGGNNNSAPDAVSMGHVVWPVPQTLVRRRALSRSSSGTNPPLSWNFSAAASAQLGSDVIQPEFSPKHVKPQDQAYGSPPARRAGLKSPAGSMSTLCAQNHIVAERKRRRERINQLFVELFRVMPSLKKMNKATILSDATKYVTELQEKLKDLESGGSNGRKSIDTMVLVKRPCLHAAAVRDDDGSPLSVSSGTPAVRKQLPKIEARFSEKSVMVRIHCEDGKGVAVKLLAGVEELHLSIIHANVLSFAEGTIIVTIMTKVEEGFTVTADEIVSRLNSALQHNQQNRCCNNTDE